MCFAQHWFVYPVHFELVEYSDRALPPENDVGIMKMNEKSMSSVTSTGGRSSTGISTANVSSMISLLAASANYKV